jgi:transmembrane sensor
MTGHEQLAATPPDDWDAIRRAAAEWHAASEQEHMDWDRFTAWLKADPRHQTAYDEIALLDSALDDHRDFLGTARDVGEVEEVVPAPHRRRGWRMWIGAAIAASLVAVLALPRFLQQPETHYQTQAAARRIALADGSIIVLAPRSSLTVSGDDQDRIALSGGAWFDIRHDPARPLAIEAGDVEIRDIGTRFDVQAEQRRIRVGVAEGSVEVSAPALDQPVRLAGGRSLRFDGAGGTALVGDLPSESMGLWRSGRLSYRNTPLSLVATDVSRYAGIEVEVAPSLRDREFSGTFVIGNGEAALRDLSQLMGLDLAGGRGRYRLVDRGR